jgi:hypothetical protein
MKLRTFLVAIAILGTVWHPAAAQPKKNCRSSSVLLDEVQSTTLGSNGDLVRHARLRVSELEGSTFRCSHGTAITGVRAFELNPSIGDRITICVHCRADDDSQLQL